MSEAPIAMPAAWLAIALGELADHVAEIPGPDANPRIVEYAKATTLGAVSDEVPWCSAFANWVMQRAGLVGTRSAMARSWLQWGELTAERFGAVVVLARGEPGSNAGHVGFYCGRRGASILVLGGNQNDRVSIDFFPADRVIGWRWPKEQ